MSNDRMVNRADLRLVLGATGNTPQVHTLLEWVDSWDKDYFRGGEISANDLKEIYKRRRNRMRDSHPLSSSVDELLAALKKYEGLKVVTVVLEKAVGCSAAIWLADPSGEVLATMIDCRGV